jgi:hypothetical protein
VIDKLPPQNIEAEEAILGGIMLDPEAIGRVSDPGQTHLISRNIILQGLNGGISYIFRLIFAGAVKFYSS